MRRHRPNALHAGALSERPPFLSTQITTLQPVQLADSAMHHAVAAGHALWYVILLTQRRRSRGSERSRSHSPVALTARTKATMARPGKSEIHHACTRYSRPAAIIDPHAGAGGGMPAPIKLSAASATTTKPTWDVASTITVGSTFGHRWRKTMRDHGAPSARAASKNSRCLRLSASDRTTRA